MTTRSTRKRMSQSELLDHFVTTTGLSRAKVKDLFAELHKLAAREIRVNGEFVLPGLGKFVKAERKQRVGRNPATGQTIQIPAKTSLKFRVGKDVKRIALSDPYTDP